MNKITIGIMFGILAGIADVILMIIQKLSWDANLSAFSLWIIVGFLIASSNLIVRGALKGIIISLMVLLPVAILLAWKDAFLLVPVLVTTIILGSLLGYFIDKFSK